MTEQNQGTLEDYLNALDPVYRTESAKDSLKQYNENKTNPKADQTNVYENLGELVGKDPRTFLDQPESGLLLRLKEWQESEKPKVQKAVTKYGGEIFNDYVGIIDRKLQLMVEDFKRENPNPTEDDFKSFEIQLYQVLGKQIRDIPMGTAYGEKNKQVYSLFKQLELIEQLSKGDRKKLKSLVTKSKGLPKMFESAPITDIWADEYLGQSDMMTREIGKAFLKGSNGKYQINAEELRKYTTGKDKDGSDAINVDSYKVMGKNVYSQYVEAMQEAKKKAS